MIQCIRWSSQTTNINVYFYGIEMWTSFGPNWHKKVVFFFIIKHSIHCPLHVYQTFNVVIAFNKHWIELEPLPECELILHDIPCLAHCSDSTTAASAVEAYFNGNISYSARNTHDSQFRVALAFPFWHFALPERYNTVNFRKKASLSGAHSDIKPVHKW
jgi:hypothetical protein